MYLPEILGLPESHHLVLGVHPTSQKFTKILHNVLRILAHKHTNK